MLFGQDWDVDCFGRFEAALGNQFSRRPREQFAVSGQGMDFGAPGVDFVQIGENAFKVTQPDG
jgi:hypothetical protein